MIVPVLQTLKTPVRILYEVTFSWHHNLDMKMWSYQGRSQVLMYLLAIKSKSSLQSI